MAAVLPPQMEQGIIPDIAREDENDAVREVLEEMADELHEWTKSFLTDPPSPAVKLKPREQFEQFMIRIAESSPYPSTRMMEVQNLLSDDYHEMIKAGTVAPPMSEPWVSLMPYGFAFKEMAKTFRRLWHQFAEVEAVA